MQAGQRMRTVACVAGWAYLLGASSCGGGGGGGGIPIVPVAAVAPPAEPPAPAPPPPPPAPPAPDVPAAPPADAPASRVVSATIASSKTGATYALEIHLPASYDGGSARYPVIYAMDGDGVFNPPGTRFANFKTILDERRTEAILVGIGGTARREQDYTLPGATAYHDFLTLELVPFIEAGYRTDPARRLLTGLSLSGSMAGIALFLEGAAGSLTFSHFLAFEGAFDFQAAEYRELEQRMHDALGDRPLAATLLLTRCDHPTECNSGPVDGLYQRLRARGQPGLAVSEATYATTHTGTDLPSFADAVARVLP
ncbi:enterochelin esterase-like enzyme [Variovorax sp. TBS-050B]|nr:enterochelin esterase-like enzyme [Variovorax sp. TBS-050B]